MLPKANFVSVSGRWCGLFAASVVSARCCMRVAACLSLGGKSFPQCCMHACTLWVPAFVHPGRQVLHWGCNNRLPVQLVHRPRCNICIPMHLVHKALTQHYSRRVSVAIGPGGLHMQNTRCTFMCLRVACTSACSRLSIAEKAKIHSPTRAGHNMRSQFGRHLYSETHGFGSCEP